MRDSYSTYNDGNPNACSAEIDTGDGQGNYYGCDDSRCVANSIATGYCTYS